MHHYWRVVSTNTFAGCYQCSRRRIDCDRKEPECAKCVAKGVKCSGLGLRYRFNDGIAARGRFVGKTVPIVDGPVSKSAKKNDAFDKRRKDDPFRESGYEGTSHREDEMDDTVDDISETTELAVTYQKPLSVDWGLDHVDPKSRFCLGYCTSPTPRPHII